MNKYLIYFLLLSSSLIGQSTNKEVPFKAGEWLKFRLHYGMVTAGYATLEVNEDISKNQFIVNGDGWTVGMFKWFFKVEDHYESRMDKTSILPTHFIRDVYEGGYTINRKVYFNRQNNSIKVEDEKEDDREDSLFTVPPMTGDMLSSYYFARLVDADTLKINDKLYFDVFIDYDIYKFSLKFLGRETIDTEFGRVKCLKFSPLVQSGRVFKEDEGVVLWISDDDNKILVRMESELRVGSIYVSLVGFKGLKHSFSVVHQ
ncbi:MAG: DUF3108 domain-containing protein [Bacteroidota bacterium]